MEATINGLNQSVLEDLLIWLNSSVLGLAFLKWWMILCAGVILICAAVIIIISLIIRKKRRARKDVIRDIPKAEPENEPEEDKAIGATAQIIYSGPLEAANLQEIGDRTEQQDDFGMTRLDEYGECGFAAVLCDGMGGMAEGGRVARQAVETMLAAAEELLTGRDKDTPVSPEAVKERIKSLSRTIYAQLFEQGGSTLVMVYLEEERMYFWCVGDSDLFLLRNGTLTALNERHEYLGKLLRKTSEGLISADQAFSDIQGSSLTHFIGRRDPEVDMSLRPLILERGDVILLCSDGISDTLTLREIQDALGKGPGQAVHIFSDIVREKDLEGQDNYTAVVIKYIGPENGRKEI